MEPGAFETSFVRDLDRLLHLRRDVRRFARDPLAPGAIDELLEAARCAPSVGYSQPWRFVLVEGEAARAAVAASFRAANADALSGYAGEDARRYAGLKLAGLDDAPVQLAVFTDEATAVGRGLGRATMPETLAYSTVAAVQNLWLAARARGLGVGWVSILDPASVTSALDVPPAWRLTAYLCIGYPIELSGTPELERAGWETRRELVLMRR
ncbi:MAG TPA: 5,6-dimethylbenzimidazole synthase [Candidatus Sulfotelmatobacter sp.]|nr:5,6-dimethylbenzimidazole synthase [Candidatus Sulfotelmatobacter sp.]